MKEKECDTLQEMKDLSKHFCNTNALKYIMLSETVKHHYQEIYEI
jgi:hypothetical protein